MKREKKIFWKKKEYKWEFKNRKELEKFKNNSRKLGKNKAYFL